MPVVITRNAGDAVAYSITRGSGQNCSNAPFLDLFEGANTVETSINLSDGDRDITICLRDAAGLTNKYVESITVDTVNPSGFMTINQGATHTTDNVVTVNITKSDNVSEMKLVNGQTIDCMPTAVMCRSVCQSLTHWLTKMAQEALAAA